jgi:hypothetical protein
LNKNFHSHTLVAMVILAVTWRSTGC